MKNTEHINEVPDTGISGVYEVFYATDDWDYTKRYFEDFGFHVVKESSLDEHSAQALYGYASRANSYRMQSGDIDSHGLLRVIVWDKPLNNGVGYCPPRTIGSRISVMMTQDIFRLNDIFNNARENGSQCFATPPVMDDLFDLDSDEKDFFSRPVVVRENAVYSGFFNHIFFQRYGYSIPGYGTVNQDCTLKTSEFTHHDFFIKASDMSEMSFMSTALGLIAEDDVALDGDWKKGPKEVFQMRPGEAHYYQGFVSPNNICGKLKFFIPTTPTVDKSDFQVMGALGITMHSFYTSKLNQVYSLVESHDLSPTSIQDNEFGELCFTFVGPGGCHWQIIEEQKINHKPKTELKFELTKN